MKIDEVLIRKVASLARLEFSEEELTGFTNKFASIIEFVEQLTAVDTTEVEGIDVLSCSKNLLDEDLTGESFSIEEALANAPQQDKQFFLAPKVIGAENES